jgi:hypothetical protein
MRRPNSVRGSSPHPAVQTSGGGAQKMSLYRGGVNRKLWLEYGLDRSSSRKANDINLLRRMSIPRHLCLYLPPQSPSSGRFDREE